MRDWIGEERNEARVLRGCQLIGPFIPLKRSGSCRIRSCADRMAEDSRGLQRLLGRKLAQAGGARGLFWQPARRFLGRGPRRTRVDRPWAVFSTGPKERL
jgi:hypothetical protein